MRTYDAGRKFNERSFHEFLNNCQKETYSVRARLVQDKLNEVTIYYYQSYVLKNYFTFLKPWLKNTFDAVTFKHFIIEWIPTNFHIVTAETLQIISQILKLKHYQNVKIVFDHPAILTKFESPVNYTVDTITYF